MTEPPPRSGSRWCGLVSLLLFAVLLTFEVFASRSGGLFGRNFWLDEIYTYLTVSDPDVGHALVALRSSVNPDPPAYSLLLRGFCRLYGSVGEIPFRLFSFLWMIVALWGLYLLLRRAFRPVVAFTAVVATWSVPLLFRYAFEARSYAMWVAAAVWFAYFLARARGETRPATALIGTALTAAILCATHYFGIITWALILGAALLANLPRSRQDWIRVAPVLAGPLALTAVIPFFLQQRAILYAATNPPVSAGQLLRVAGELFPPTHLPALAIACWLSMLARSRRPASALEPATDLSGLAGLSGLLLLPIVLLAFSLDFRPVIGVPRYMVTTVIATSVIAGCLLSRTSRPFLVCIIAFYTALGAAGLREFARLHQRRDADTAARIAELRALKGNAPVIFEINRDLFVFDHYEPALTGRCFFLDFEEGQIGNAGSFRINERNLARVAARFYGRPPLLKWDDAAKLDRLYLVPGYRDPTDLKEIESDYRVFAARPVSKNLVELTARRK